jgi:hypothetical protein
MKKSINYSKLCHSGLLLSLFFLISFGLGYPTLNRYNPQVTEGTSDSLHYFNIVKSGPQNAVGHWRSRVLVPYLAKPFYYLAKGKTRTWNPISFAMLVINSIFVATSAYLLILLALEVIGDYFIALVSGLFYLLNFNIANAQLSGLVDSAEACLIMAVILLVITNRWWCLPVLGIIGALAKETFVPLAGSWALIYWICESSPRKRPIIQLTWIIGMVAVGMVTIVILRSLISGIIVWPWDIIASEKGPESLFLGVFHCLADKGFWYVFVWLLPLGVLKLKYFPKSLIFASIGSAIVALLLGGWKNAGGNVAKPIFNTLAPLLTISLAYFISSLKIGNHQ